MKTKPTFMHIAAAAIAMVVTERACKAQRETELKRVEDLLALIEPAEAARPNGDWNAADTMQATTNLRALEGKQVHFTVPVDWLTKNIIYLPKLHRPGGEHPYIVDPTIEVSYDAQAIFAGVAKGQIIEIAGKLGFSSIRYLGPAAVSMCIHIENPVLVKPAAPKAEATKPEPSAVVALNGPPSTILSDPKMPETPIPSSPKPNGTGSSEDSIFTSIESMLSMIVDSEVARPNGEWKIATANEATKQLGATKGKQVHLTAKIERISKTSIYLPKIRRDGGGHPYDVSIAVYVPRDEPTLLAGVAQGQTIELTGELRSTSIHYRGPAEVDMSIHILNARVQKPSVNPLAAPKAVVALTPVPPVGVAVNNPPASSTPITANPTASLNRPNARVGALDHPPGLSLHPRWDARMQGDSLTLRDLDSLLSKFATRGRDLSPHPEITIYGSVKYLMPLEDAKLALGLAKRVNSKNLVACSGFPSGTLFQYGFSGSYGEFNQLYIVTDKADQVISIQLVGEHQRNATRVSPTGPWHSYNFVNARYKSQKTLQIAHSAKKISEVLAINSMLEDPHGKILERVQWHVPIPIVSLILECVAIQGGGAK